MTERATAIYGHRPLPDARQSGDTSLPAIGNYTIKRAEDSGVWLAVHSRRSPEPFRSKQIVVTAEAEGVRAKIVSICWEKDLGYYVYLGYFDPPHAVLGRYVNDAPHGSSVTLNLRESGQISKQRLKYSHHASGQAHFSLHRQDPLIENHTLPLAINQSAPPARGLGYVFSVMFRDLESFELVAPASARGTLPLPRNRRQLNFRHAGLASTPRKLIGWWYPIRAFAISDYGDGLPWEPKPVHFRPDGEALVSGFLIAPPEDWPWSDHGLVISDDTANAPTSPLDAYLVLQGGFRREYDERGNDAGESFIAAIFSAGADDDNPAT